MTFSERHLQEARKLSTRSTLPQSSVWFPYSSRFAMLAAGYFFSALAAALAIAGMQ